MIKRSNKTECNNDRVMNTLKLTPGYPNECELHSFCPECEHLLQCAEDDSAWTDDTLEEVRILAFASAFIHIRTCAQAKEELFLRTFKIRMTAELGTCTSADLKWAKTVFNARGEKIEELERRFKEELEKLFFEDSDTALIDEYAKKLDRYYGPLMTEEEFWEVIKRADKQFDDNAK